jgi:hypothetical protein
MTNLEIIYTVQNLLNRGGVSDDTLLSNRQLEFIVDYIRAAYVKAEVKANKSIGNVYAQTLDCIPLVRVDAYNCCNLPVECRILRTQNPIPMFIETLFVGSVNGDSISKTSSETAQYTPYKRYGKNELLWFNNKVGNDTYIYVMNTLMLKNIRIKAIFENPKEIASINTCGTVTGCKATEYEYPMPLSDLQEIIRRLTVQEIRLLKSTTADTLNNANQDN